MDHQQSITSLPISNKEKFSRNRNKSGYNVYQSWFYHDWHQYSSEKKKELLCQYGIHNVNDYDDDDSITSDPPITPIHVLRLCARYWSYQPESIKQQWNSRAIIVNTLPILGVFDSTPTAILDADIAYSMTQEYDRIRSCINQILKSKQPFDPERKERTFGLEKVTTGGTNQVYKSFFCNHLLQLSFFGSNFSLFNSSTEIAYKRKNSMVVHLYSLQRLKEVFELNGINMFLMKKDDGTIIAAAPKIIIDMDGKEGIGLVKNETNGYLNVLLENGEELNICKPQFDCEMGIWKHNDDCTKIKEFHPFRMKILKKSGFIHILFNKFNLSANSNNILT